MVFLPLGPKALSIRDVGLLFLVETITALCRPVVIDMIADRYSPTRTALLGKKWSVMGWRREMLVDKFSAHKKRR